VYYVREDIMKRATSVARDQLVSLGVCVGKFTHSDKFRLTIGALELLAAHAKHKVSYAAAFGETYRFVAKQRVFFRRRRFFFFFSRRAASVAR
jgi:ribosome biogenesis protein Nip4